MSKDKFKTIRFNPEYKDDAELFEKANQLGNFSGFVKDLLRLVKIDHGVDLSKIEIKLKESENENS